MIDKYQEEVLQYFSGKADGYDLVELQKYWQLSDQLLWDHFNAKVLSNLPKNFSFLDAGGGTGRWSEKVLKYYQDSIGIIYDLSPDMLREAEKKRVNGLENRLELRQGNIEHMADIKQDTFDLTFTFHNVLGFVESPQDALNELSRVTKKGGSVISVVPNKYHCIFFNLMVGHVNEAKYATETGRGRFTLDMPYMNLFTPNSLEELYLQSGLNVDTVYGFPVTIYPGMQETQITGSTKKLANLLENSDNYDNIYKIEHELTTLEELAPRGNNLLIIGTKQEEK